VRRYRYENVGDILTRQHLATMVRSPVQFCRVISRASPSRLRSHPTPSKNCGVHVKHSKTQVESGSDHIDT